MAVAMVAAGLEDASRLAKGMGQTRAWARKVAAAMEKAWAMMEYWAKPKGEKVQHSSCPATVNYLDPLSSGHHGFPDCYDCPGFGDRRSWIVNWDHTVEEPSQRGSEERRRCHDERPQSGALY